MECLFLYLLAIIVRLTWPCRLSGAQPKLVNRFRYTFTALVLEMLFSSYEIAKCFALQFVGGGYRIPHLTLPNLTTPPPATHLTTLL